MANLQDLQVMSPHAHACGMSWYASSPYIRPTAMEECSRLQQGQALAIANEQQNKQMRPIASQTHFTFASVIAN